MRSVRSNSATIHLTLHSANVTCRLAFLSNNNVTTWRTMRLANISSATKLIVLKNFYCKTKFFKFFIGLWPIWPLGELQKHDNIIICLFGSEPRGPWWHAATKQSQTTVTITSVKHRWQQWIGNIDYHQFLVLYTWYTKHMGRLSVVLSCLTN